MTIFLSVFAGASLLSAIWQIWQWSRPRGALYPADHFLVPAGVFLILAGLFALAAAVVLATR